MAESQNKNKKHKQYIGTHLIRSQQTPKLEYPIYFICR